MRRAELWGVLVLFALSLLGLGVLGARGWPGEPPACLAAGDCYCEAARDALVRQPANTWSCLVGAGVALLVAWHTGRVQSRPLSHRPASFLASRRFFAALYSGILMYSVVAAMAFHASLTNWGGKLDLSSIFLFIDFWIAFNLARVFDLSRTAFALIWLLATALLLVPRVLFDVLGFSLLASLVTAAILCEVALGFPGLLERCGARRRFRLDRRWLYASLALYLPALAVWRASFADSPMCDPTSLWQGHAAWHVLTALSPGALYLYFLCGESALPAPSASNR